MPSRKTETLNVSAAGVVAPIDPTWPEGGGTLQVSLTQGTCVVVARVGNLPAIKEEAIEFTLPVPVGEEGAGNLHDGAALDASWRYYDWHVKSIVGGGTLSLNMTGVGV